MFTLMFVYSNFVPFLFLKFHHCRWHENSLALFVLQSLEGAVLSFSGQKDKPEQPFAGLKIKQQPEKTAGCCSTRKMYQIFLTYDRLYNLTNYMKGQSSGDTVKLKEQDHFPLQTNLQ